MNHGASNMRDRGDKLKFVYGETYKEDIADMDDAEIAELAGNLKKVPIGTPVFDGAHERDISEMLKKANVNVSGQVKLFDADPARFRPRCDSGIHIHAQTASLG